jgi:hypothetical protein
VLLAHNHASYQFLKPRLFRSGVERSTTKTKGSFFFELDQQPDVCGGGQPIMGEFAPHYDARVRCCGMQICAT